MSSAVVVQSVARLPFPAEDGGSIPTLRLHFTSCSANEMAPLLATHHYLGPVPALRLGMAGWVDNEMVCAMAWRWPMARMIPADGTWLELSRWCLTPHAGSNAGSRMMRWARRYIKQQLPNVRTLVSYSDPSVGHTGALYRASGWDLSQTQTRLGASKWVQATGRGWNQGAWDGSNQSGPKDRWMIHLKERMTAC